MGKFSKLLLKWYSQNKRDLPWRANKNPYHIWLSEIILQQTRVDQGLPYFLNFTDRFKSIVELANASEDEVLKLWQGLGYYSRARNMHYSAKLIRDQYDGVFPNSYDEIIQLKGVGEYTAAAISSIAFNIPKPVLDGNVFRVISRYYGLDLDISASKSKPEFMKLLEREIDHSQPGEFNQAIMEFGAIHCTPAKASCQSCPLKNNCFAFNNGLVEQLPVKLKKIKQRKRYFNYIVISDSKSIILQKRTGKDIWQGLYEFPMIEDSRLLELEELQNNSEFPSYSKQEAMILEQIIDLPKHQLSHQQIFTRFFVFKMKLNQSVRNRVNSNEIHEYPVSRIIDKFLETKPEFIWKK